MKRLFIITLMFFLKVQFGFSENTLSSSATITVLTADPGREEYSLYGHTAIWIKDSINQIDKVYNYGIFNFSDPNFLPKFIKGQLDYYVDVYSFDQYIAEYIYDNRSVYAQELNFSSQEKQQVYDFLEWNILPENKTYRYVFLSDNCCTRVRDVIEKILAARNEKLVLSFTQKITYRQVIRLYGNGFPFLNLGMDILLGDGVDRPMTPREFTFLPDNLKLSLAATPNILKQKTYLLFDARAYKPESPWYTYPAPIFFILLCVTVLLSWIEWKYKRDLFILDGILFVFVSLLSFLMLYAWFNTEHTVTQWNFNILWCNPILFILGIGILFFRKLQFTKRLAALVGISMPLIAFSSFFIQPYMFAIYILMTILSIRALIRYKK